MAKNITITNDSGFGPILKATNHQHFDFTLFFEETILSILPSCVFLAALPLRVLQLQKAPRKVEANFLHVKKAALVLLFLSLTVANTVLWSLKPKIRTHASFATVTLSTVVALGLCLLSYLEHVRNIRPSSVINAYLLLAVPLDAAKVRTLWIRQGSVVLACFASGILTVKVLLLIAESTEKKGILLPPYRNFGPESVSGLYSRGLFWWLNPILFLGFKRTISEDDIYRTENDLSSSFLHKRFQNRWNERGHRPHSKYILIRVVARCMLMPLLTSALPRLCLIFFRYMQPLLIKRVTRFIDQPGSPTTMSQGWSLTAAYGIVYIGLAISTAMYYHKSARMATMIRGTLVTAIYKQTLDLSLTALDKSAAVTLMSTDVQRICDSVPQMNELWASPVEIAVAIWLLVAEIGLAALGPLILTLVAVSITVVMTPRITIAQKQWLSGIQTRIEVTTKLLQTMKGIKVLGFAATLSDAIQQLRMNEIDLSIASRRLFGINLMFGNTPNIFSPGIAFTIFVVVAARSGQTIDVSSAYTTLSIIALLTTPIAALIYAFPPLLAAAGCFDRIQAFLLSAARQDHRLLLSQIEDCGSIPSKNFGNERVLGSDGIEMRLLKTQTTDAFSGNIIIRSTSTTLYWNNSAIPAVSDVSFDISNGSLTMFVGPVGCGKSTLLKGLLGEIPASKGSIWMGSLDIAFVDQVPWIWRGTIRDNIIGVSDFEETWYSRVIYACALDGDLKSLPQGAQTSVGSAGGGLSGGQILRLALARAVYSRRRILVLDDILSGLDPASEEHLFVHLFGKSGLLRSNGTTVLLATHAVHRLPHADWIVALKTNGSISEQGTYAHIRSIEGYISSLSSRRTNTTPRNTHTTVLLLDETDYSKSAHENATEALNHSDGDLPIYKYYFEAVGWRNTVLFLCLTFLFAFFERFPDLWIKFWITAAEAHGNKVNSKFLGLLLAFEAAAWLALLWSVMIYLLVMIPTSARKLHARLLETVKNAPLAFFTSTDIGKVINRFSQDMDVIDFELPMAFFQLCSSSCTALMQAIFICLSAAYFAATMPVVLGLMYLVQKFYLRTSRQIRLMDLETKSPLYANFIESLNGLVTIRAFGWTSTLEARHMDLLDASQRPFYMLFCIQRWLTLVLDLTVAGLVVVLMVLIVLFRETLDSGLVGLGLVNVMNFNISLMVIVKLWTTLETSLGAISRVKSFVQDTAVEHLSMETCSVPDNWPARGSIEVSDVSASYTADSKAVLRNFNMSIPAGQKLGLCGRTGSGKSSFVSMLFHLLEIGNGTVEIDDIDICTIPRETLRERLNIIPQEPVFWSGTIRENLKGHVNQAVTDVDIENALRKVGLWSTITNAGGLAIAMNADELLSQGQKQLFCLARAMLKSSRVLILDEATASVDIETDEIMQKVIRENFAGCTIIAVAHRLQTIMDFDRVAVLDNGLLVEHGVPGKLLQDPQSKFRALWEL